MFCSHFSEFKHLPRAYFSNHDAITVGFENSDDDEDDY